MDDQLPEEKLNELLPCLRPLAELVSAGKKIDRKALGSIASEIGINGEARVFAELELWGGILVKCRDKLCTKDAIVAELRNRGIPEFPAMLAYESARPKPLKPLTVEPLLIDFGCLKIGEGASNTLQASGEPIIDMVCGRRLKVTLLKAGSPKTMVQVQLSGGAAGETFKEEIILRGNTGEVRVTVIARWEEERPRLSHCPVCKISKKSLFWNHVAKEYECLNLECKATGPDLDKLVSPFRRC